MHHDIAAVMCSINHQPVVCLLNEVQARMHLLRHVYNTMQSNEQAKALVCHAHNLKMK